MTSPELKALREVIAATLEQMDENLERFAAEHQRLRFNLRQVLDGKVPPSVVLGPITDTPRRASVVTPLAAIMGPGLTAKDDGRD